LKVLAKKLDIPIIALCQMSRAIEGSGRRPVLSDLRESGSLEQDADVVIFLYDESEYDPDKAADGTIEAIVKKNRKGPNETVKLAFNKRWSRFMTLTKGTQNESDSSGTARTDDDS
jgi:replicative DNA helicase